MIGTTGTLRVHFTSEDLARVRVATAPDPLWETVLGLQQLSGPANRTPAVFADWRRRAVAELNRRQLLRPAKLLQTLAGPARYWPDFLTPAAASAGLAEGLEAVLGTAPNRLADELRLLGRVRCPQRPVPPWLRDLAGGDRERLDEVVHALRALHDSVIAPEWTELHATLESDRALRARALRDGGVHALLSSLGPAFRWEAPVLHARYPVDRDLHLGGRGLHLIPAYFCHRTPVALTDENLTPVLVYPVARGACADPPAAAPLSALLGSTRARTLSALRGAATTGEIARRLRISAPSASEHVRCLRGAGLVHSSRTGPQVLHTLTPLGEALLRGGIG